MSQIAFFDIEVNPETNKILDIGAIRSDNAVFHKNHLQEFVQFINPADFLIGHNVFAHDLTYIQKETGNPAFGLNKTIDTLLLSPLLFPKNPYHHLLKDEKFDVDELNNPVNDSKKARDLFYDEVEAFNRLPIDLKSIFFQLLHEKVEYSNFFKYVKFTETHNSDLEKKIRTVFHENICANCNVSDLIKQNPVALSYALTLINCNDRYSITPHWVLRNHSAVERVLFQLRSSPCITGCGYCDKALNPYPFLKRHFGFTTFRTYEDVPLQESAVKAAIQNKSFLVVFPTGGGKSITFQLPALMSGENAKALTVVISPLQSLMKDQVDNLEKKGITEAVTINGLLDPIERAKAIERVEAGLASILYISPESLRSITIERLLLKRKIARFVVDEAHCFSSWGQDFRVDYLYIGDFIKTLQEKKNLEDPIPVSCFTATAKQKVIEDIRNYFKEKLNLDLELFKANASRTNLHYEVFEKSDEEEKYNHLRLIIESKNCPSIVYVSRTKTAVKLSERLTSDGFEARPFYGKMDPKEKTSNQNAFMKGDVNIIVATSAFGMGVDKPDVGTVIHYDISDSLENYVQEAGRAGRDEKINADCYVLFNEEDLDKHFILLNQTKISSKEINQVWKAIKGLTKSRQRVSNSALEIARRAGWDDGIRDVETRITTAIAALEEAGYVKRGQNMPRVFANSILSKTAQEAINRIKQSERFAESQKQKATRIIKKLFSSKSKRLSTEEEAESRVDYISDQLGIVKEEVVRIIELLREENILADAKDLTAFIKRGENTNSLSTVKNFSAIEDALLNLLHEDEKAYHLKEINEKCAEANIDSSVNQLKTILNFWSIKNWIKRQSLNYSKFHVNIALTLNKQDFHNKLEKIHFVSGLIIQYLYEKAKELKVKDASIEDILVEFSVQELKDMVIAKQGMFKLQITIDDIEDCLFYLSRIEAIKIEGGFLVVHNKLCIDRLELNNQIQFKKSDYEKLELHYQQKVQQIHIVGEYAKKMIRNYNEALQFVDDYFSLNYPAFLRKYFPGSRENEIRRPLTPEKFRKLFGALSPTQLEIIKDSNSKYIVVAAGPGSGKTRVLVHKLASLLLTEDVKHEHLLMLTFSRAAATDFKKKLLALIGNAANYIEIKTFHSYCFDLLGKVGSLTQADTILTTAIDKIRGGEIERSRITKTVLVVDEAQDMSENEYELIKALMENNEEMRVILVGDDDQNIYGFRGSDSRYMQLLLKERDARFYELVDNYRSKSNIVEYSNQWARRIAQRLKITPGFAIQQHDGRINVTQYRHSNLLLPLAEAIEKENLVGSTCILTKTNDEATQLTGLLAQKGLPAKLIQSNDGFHFNNLFEVRYFSNNLNGDPDSPLISDEEWEGAVKRISNDLKNSAKLDVVLAAIRDFEEINKGKKYKSDWKAFVQESKIEDFTNIDNETIFVSTIHKAKGKEFDNVILMLNGFMPNSDEQKRLLYVALTRPKSNLMILYNGSYLGNLTAANLAYRHDNAVYDDVMQVALSLTHKDVQLNYFKYVQHRIDRIHTGAKLTVLEDGLGDNQGEKVLRYSQSFKNKLEEWMRKGFVVVNANINFIVYWKQEMSSSELKVVLPELTLRRSS